MDKEEFLFNLKKDCPFKNFQLFKKDIIEKHKISNINFKDLYARIVNYQIIKYGETLYYVNDYDNETLKDKAKQERWRKSKRRNYESKRRYV